MSLKYKKVVSVGAVVLNSEGKILLLFQKDNKFWDLPKGRQEKGESIEETMIREVKEEASIENFEKIPDFQYKITYKHKAPENVLVDKKVWVNLLKTNDEVKLSLEHTDYKWFTIEEARKVVKHKNQIELLDYLEKFAREKGIYLKY